MWGYQPHFRLTVERSAETALEEIGAAALKPLVILIGFRVDPDARHAICVEPERGPLQPDDLETVLERTDELAGANPEASMWHSDARLQKVHEESILRDARATALREAIDASGAHPDTHWQISRSSRVGGYDVHTCIGVKYQLLESMPALESELLDRIRVERSLPRSILGLLARQADAEPKDSELGPGLRLGGLATFEVVRRAAWNLAEGCVVRTGEYTGGDLFDTIESIASQHYEGSAAHGRIVLARQGHPAVHVKVRLLSPVSMRRGRAIRKLLETTDSRMALLTTGSEVYGIGALEAYDPTGQDAFEITLTGHATWELAHANCMLMRVAYGHAALKAPSVDREYFDDVVSRIFDGMTRDVEAIWRAVEAAAATAHGTMLVVAADAQDEAARLCGQSTLIEPVELSQAVLACTARIDGAVLLDPQGVCHAIGVILDGSATGRGDPSRGARFNSAIRYLDSHSSPTMIVVVSSDGSIDLFPQLRPRINRSKLALVIDQVKAIAAGELDPEAFARAWDQIKELSFYLSELQCLELNTLYKEYQQRRLDAGGIAVYVDALRPDPEMSDEYFLG